MLTTERLEEIRASHLKCLQEPFLGERVKQLQADIADALGELIEYRIAGPIHRDPPQNVRLLGEVQ